MHALSLQAIDSVFIFGFTLNLANGVDWVSRGPQCIALRRLKVQAKGGIKTAGGVERMFEDYLVAWKIENLA